MPTLEVLFAEMSELSELGLELGSLTSFFARACLLPQNKTRPATWLQENDLRIGHLNPTLANPTTLTALTEKQPSSIGYQLSKRTEAIPEDLIKTCKTLNIALFSIPPDTTTQTVQSKALALILKESNSLPSHTQITQELLTTLKSYKAERSLLDKLHSLTGGSFLLLSQDNRTLSSAGPLRIPKTRLLSLPEGSYQLQIREDTYTAFLFKISSSESNLQTVFVAVIHDLSQIGLIENAAFMLSLIQEKQQARLQREGILREAFLSEWFADSFDTLSFQHQLTTMGFDVSADYAVIVVLLVKEDGSQLSNQDTLALLESIQLTALGFFENLSLTTLSSIRPKYQNPSEDSPYNPHCIFVFSGANSLAQLEPLEHVLSTIQSSPQSGENIPYKLQLGLSQESNIYSASELKLLYQQAQQAAQQAKISPQQFHTPEPLTWLLNEQSPDKLQAITDALLKPIQEADKSGRLLDTLIAYLDKPNSFEQLAESLEIHINTLRYRLKKIETLTGKSLANPKSLAEFYMVLEIMALREAS